MAKLFVIFALIGSTFATTCTDKASNCASTASYCDNPLYVKLMSEQCAKTCKRCSSSTVLGECVNQFCATGYYCGAGNLCYSNPTDSGTVMGECVGGSCPTGYYCGSGNLCYSSSG